MSTGDARPQAFISYSHKDRQFVDRLYEDLRAHGTLQIWLDREILVPGDSILRMIERGIAAEYFLAILSPNHLASPIAQEELYAAYNIALRTGHTKIIPILYQSCELPPFLAEKLYADFRTSYTKGLTSVLRALGMPTDTVSSMTLDESCTLTLKDRGDIAHFDHVRTFECARLNVREMCDLKLLTGREPHNVTVSSGTFRIERAETEVSVRTTLEAPLPLQQPITRRVSYELHGGIYSKVENTWFYRIPSSFNSLVLAVQHGEDRCIKRIATVFETEGFEREGIEIVREDGDEGMTRYVVHVPMEAARYRTIRFKWSW